MNQPNATEHARGDLLEESFREAQNALDLLEAYLRERIGYDHSPQPNPIDLLVRLRREVITRSLGRPGDSPSCSGGVRNPTRKTGVSV